MLSIGRSRGALHCEAWRSGPRSVGRKRYVSPAAPGTIADLTELRSQHTSRVPCHPVRPCLQRRTSLLFLPTLLSQHPSLHPPRAPLCTHAPSSRHQQIPPSRLLTSPAHRRSLSLASRRRSFLISRAFFLRRPCTRMISPSAAHSIRICLHLNSPSLASALHPARTRSCRALHKSRPR